MSLSRDTASAAILNVADPATGKSLEELYALEKLGLGDDQSVTVELRLEKVAEAGRKQVEDAIGKALAELGAREVTFAWTNRPTARRIGPEDPVPQVQNVILVMSGKGGVGKSTVATNTALALARQGYRVGLLDADIYGPSIPTMMGVAGRPTTDGDKIKPLERFGIELMSIGFLLEDAKAAVVWRGPMLHGALMQFLKDVAWSPLDYLILDLPPGTGDVTLTLSQKVAATGAIVVTTPQEVALADVYKSVSMAKKVSIPILGVVENESYFICDGCDKRHELFGAGGGAKVAEFAEAPLLGQIPMDPEVTKWGDTGVPVVQAAPNSSVAKVFNQIAEKLIEAVERRSDLAQGPLTIDRSGGVNRHLPITR